MCSGAGDAGSALLRQVARRLRKLGAADVPDGLFRVNGLEASRCGGTSARSLHARIRGERGGREGDGCRRNAQIREDLPWHKCPLCTRSALHLDLGCVLVQPRDSLEVKGVEGGLLAPWWAPWFLCQLYLSGIHVTRKGEVVSSSQAGWGRVG